MPESPGYLGHLGNTTERLSDAITLQHHQVKHPDHALDRTYHVKGNLPSRFGSETEEKQFKSELLAIDGVEAVVFARYHLTIVKGTMYSWENIQPAVVKEIEKIIVSSSTASA
jgi:hypothetical protein